MKYIYTSTCSWCC